jgi:hypothetical protein
MAQNSSSSSTYSLKSIQLKLKNINLGLALGGLVDVGNCIKEMHKSKLTINPNVNITVEL